MNEFLNTVYLFFSSNSLFDFFLCAGMSWASKSLASSLSFFAFDWGSLVNWKVNEFPSWSTSWICILELPSGLIRWTVEHKENEFEHLHIYRKRQDLNCFFGQLCTDNDYHKPEFIPVPYDAEIACISEMQVWRSLLGLNKTATGPDQIPFWIWKDHGEILAPVVTKIWNLSLETHAWPSSWKSANITPIPKVEIPKENGDFRGINITPLLLEHSKRLFISLTSRTLSRVA